MLLILLPWSYYHGVMFCCLPLFVFLARTSLFKKKLIKMSSVVTCLRCQLHLRACQLVHGEGHGWSKNNIEKRHSGTRSPYIDICEKKIVIIFCALLTTVYNTCSWHDSRSQSISNLAPICLWEETSNVFQILMSCHRWLVLTEGSFLVLGSMFLLSASRNLLFVNFVIFCTC